MKWATCYLPGLGERRTPTTVELRRLISVRTVVREFFPIAAGRVVLVIPEMLTRGFLSRSSAVLASAGQPPACSWVSDHGRCGLLDRIQSYRARRCGHLAG